jgi:hypothetical protein
MNRRAYTVHKARIRERVYEWRKKNPEKYRAIEERHRTQYRGVKKQTHIERRLLVLNFYSKGSMKCACCGEKELVMLTIDHINNDGGRHRKSDKSAGYIVWWIIKNNFPSGFQVLCMNCNWAKRITGICPHKSKSKSYNDRVLQKTKQFKTIE